MKRFCFILILGILAFSRISADSSYCDECCDILVTAPDWSSQFEVEAQYLYVQPTVSNIDYAAVINPVPLPTSPNWRIKSIKPDFTSAFQIGVGYALCSKDIKLNWTHLNAKDSSSERSRSLNIVAPLFSVGPQGVAFRRAHGRVTHHFDEVNLNIGQYLDICDRFKMRLYAGASFVRVRQSTTSRFSDSIGTTTLKIHNTSEFTSGGPQFGVRSSYEMGWGFGLVGELASFLLIGDMRRHTTFTSASPISPALGLPIPNFQRTRSDSTMQTLPGFDGTIGLSYFQCFCNGAILFNVEIGYRAALFFGAIQSVDPSTLSFPPDAGAVNVSSFEKHISDFGFNGPYASLSLDF